MGRRFPAIVRRGLSLLASAALLLVLAADARACPWLVTTIVPPPPQEQSSLETPGDSQAPAHPSPDPPAEPVVVGSTLPDEALPRGAVVESRSKLSISRHRDPDLNFDYGDLSAMLRIDACAGHDGEPLPAPKWSPQQPSISIPVSAHLARCLRPCLRALAPPQV